MTLRSYIDYLARMASTSIADRAPRPLAGWTLTAIGVIFVSLGTIGIFVPLLPTTPFLLLAAACFVRSSPRLHAWLTGHRVLGPYIRNYRDHRAMTRPAKAIALTLLWCGIGYSAIAATRTWWVRLLLALVAIGVTIHLLHLKTLAPERDS